MDFTLIISLVLGWLFGWAVNYLADVLPVARKLSHPSCLQCQTPFRWADYLFFRNCSACGKRRVVRAPIVQVLLLVASVLLWLFPRSGLPFLLALPLLAFLTLVMVTDLEYRLILHPVSLVGAILGLGIGIYLHSRHTTLAAGLVNTLMGGIFGFAIMLVFYFAGEWYVRRMSKKRNISPDEIALGFGDVNLAGILGMLLGWPTIVAGLFFAILAGGLVSLGIVVGMLISKKYKSSTAIPYAPFLILSAIYLLYL